MTTFDRFILRRIAIGFGALVLLLIVFYVALHYVEFMDDFYDRDAETSEVWFVYYPNLIPEIIKLTAPLALFLSAIFVTSKLAQQLQIAVLMTSGVSIFRLMVPYVALGVLAAAGILWFNGWIVPESNRVRIEIEFKYFKDERTPRKTRDIHMQDTPSSVVTTKYFDARSDIAYEVSLQRFDSSNRIKERLDAREMRWIDSTRTWRMFDVTKRIFEPQMPVRRIGLAFKDTTLNVTPRDLRRTERDVELLTIPEAGAYLASLRRSGASNIGRPQVEYWSKFTYPLANLILILMSLPLAAVRRPGGQAVQLGIGLAIAFLYLALVKLSEPLGYAGTLPPLIAAFLPHALFCGFAVWLYARVRT